MSSAPRVFQRRLCYEEIDPSEREIFEQLYAIYADLFPLPDEREPPEAFLEIAALNHRSDVQSLYGPWREIVAGIRLRKDGPLVGGNIFGVTTSEAHRKFGCQASIQDIYLFLERSARGKGVMADAKAHMEAEALATFGLDPKTGKFPPLIFLEVNNPTRMSAAEIEEDIARSGINPYRRYASWKRNGFAPLAFGYVQPPLRSGASAVSCLDLFCTVGVAEAIPAEIIRAHLKAFISISVLKGRPAEENADFSRMVQELTPGTLVQFVPETSKDQQIIAQNALAAG